MLRPIALCLVLVGCQGVTLRYEYDGGAMPTDAPSATDAGVPAMDAGPPPMPDAGCVLADPPSVPAWTTADTGGPSGEGVLTCISRLSAAGASNVDRRIPHDQRYDMTTFGGGSDSQGTSCGPYADGTWYYSANAHRFSCGSHIRITDEARTHCVIVEVADVGPHICVEEHGGRAIWDVSPLAAQHLFGVTSSGWSEHRHVIGAQVTEDNPLGACDAQLADPSAFLRGWIGGPCATDADCPYDGAVCLRDWPGGHCSRACTTGCPDRAGANAYTACADTGGGVTMCAARCDFTLFPVTGCREGYGCEEAAVPQTVRDACMPLECR